MQKLKSKFVKIVLLLAVVFFDLMTPVNVLANEILKSNPNKGDIGIDNEVSNTGSVTVSSGSLNNEGDVLVTKTVSKTDILGRYKVEFNIKGKDVINSTEVIKPVYAVVVFDRSGSMASTETETDECARYEKWHGIEYCAEYKTVSNNKWESAVQGAKDFANTLLKKIDTANIALVAFSGNDDRNDTAYNDATVLRNFSNTNLDSTNFGIANGGTNLQAGLYEANKLLNDPNIPSDAYKYVVVISDGQPTFYYDSKGYTQGEGDSTNTNTYNTTINMANTVKNTTKAEVFSIGYMLPSGTVYGNKTAADILTEVSSKDKVNSNVKHYVDGKPEDVANAFTNIANEISRVNAGTNAILTDNLGGSFTLNTTGDKRYVSEVIPKITEEVATLSFYIDIDPDSVTGWHDTNAGFKLEYTNYKGEKQILECNENPQVYWIQNTYDYIVNYYKDSFDSNNLIESETRKASNGTIINESNIERDKYLPTGYEFNNINPNIITITNDEIVKEINILYTIKKFNYVVKYYYDDILDSSLAESNIPYGTSVDSKTYYLEDSDIRDGYILDIVKSDSQMFTITDNTVVIDIYYKKNNYGYSVNYFFNSEKGFTTNDSTIYGDKITAQSKWLSNNKLFELDKADYFLDPNKREENNKEITIGTDKDKNVLDIYYINTNFDNTNEVISKITNTEKVISSSQKVSYKITYNTSINNVRNGDKVVVTITDTLPGSIIENESILNGGVYNSTDNTITWTYTHDINEYQEIYRVSKEISYTVKYENYLSFNGNTLVNTVNGYTTVSHEGLNDKVTEGKEDSATVPVEIKGTVNVYFKDNDDNEIATKVALGEKLAGTSYTTNAKNIFGYTLDETKLPSNASGNYIEGNIDVMYYYTKNDGEIENPITEKTGPDTVESIDGTFRYKITGSGNIKKYVGNATLIVKDILPYTIDTQKSILDNRCQYNANDNIITCRVDYNNITENDYTNGVFEVNETFNLSLVFIGVDLDKVINKATSTIKLEGNEITTEDEEETEIYKGTVVVTYKAEDGTILHDDVKTTDLAGKYFKTEEKEFYGYTLKEVPSNKDGKYIANETIIVNYLYTKNVGTSSEEFEKVGNTLVDNINGKFDYLLNYHTIINDYVGKIKLTITDILPYEIDLEKSIFSENCKYTDGKLVCTYDGIMIDENNREVSISEEFSLYYIGVDSKVVTNKAEAILTYGDIVKKNDDEINTGVKEGTVIVNYVTLKDGEYVKLTDTITLTDLVGNKYETNKKEFDKYSFAYVVGEKEGKFAEGVTEVTYVYSLIPLPPQTGFYGMNLIIILEFVFTILSIVILRRAYKLLKNN